MKQQVFSQVGVAGSHLVQIAADVESVERELARLASSSVQVVEQVGKHTLEAGGKRLRPAFLILSARATGHAFAHERAILLGACLELIHMATLIHDDVIDEADLRRGRPTASRVFGNTAAILSGDVMLARSMTILADDGDIEIIRAASRMVVEMAEGEARELEVRGDFDLSVNDHLAVLRMKTAAFVECCCRLGALLAKADPAAVDALSRYGHHLGMAFQIIDDILDLRGDSSKTGKPRGTDFREGCMTLPMILFRDRAHEAALEPVRACFGAVTEDSQIDHLVEQIESIGAFAEAERVADEHLTQAMDALKELPESAHRDLLAAAGQFVVRRSA